MNEVAAHRIRLCIILRLWLCLLATPLSPLMGPGAIGAQEKSDISKAGESLYQANCAVCHGDQGNGKTWVSGTLNPPPRNFTDPAVIQFLNRERMRESIMNGRPGTGMQPWKSRLSENEIDAVIDYIRGTFMKLDIEAEKKK